MNKGTQTFIGMLGDLTNWLFGFMWFVFLIMFSLYVYMTWVPPWSWLYWIGLIAYLIKFCYNYTDPKNMVIDYTSQYRKPKPDWLIASEEYDRREREYKLNRGIPLDEDD